jgi:SAM-dependent methyltransferase
LTATVPDTTTFDRVDDAADPDGFVAMLDLAAAEPSWRELKEIIVGQLDLRPGARVLDVGCGTGDQARAIAAAVGSTGEVCGVDGSTLMLEVARARSAASPATVRFLPGDVGSLPFADGEFDACTEERVLVHVADPRRALGEMVRVTRPGGTVVLFEGEAETLLVNHPDAAMTRLVAGLMTGGLHQSRIARHLPGLAADAGLVDVRVRPHVLMAGFPLFRCIVWAAVQRGAQSDAALQARLKRWWADLAGSARAGRFLGCFVGFVVAGRKPG